MLGEGCMPVEAIAKRGEDSLRFGLGWLAIQTKSLMQWFSSVKKMKTAPC